MRMFAGAALALLLLLPFGTCAAWSWAPASFTIANASGQPIGTLTIHVAGKTFTYENIPPWGRVSGSFRVQQEESLDVRGRLTDGTEFAESCGYVAWEEFAPHINVVVLGDGQLAVPH